MQQSHKEEEILRQSYKDLFILAELPIGSDKIFNIDLNGALKMHIIIVHNLLMQTWNRLIIFSFLHGYLLIDATSERWCLHHMTPL